MIEYILRQPEEVQVGIGMAAGLIALIVIYALTCLFFLWRMSR